MSLLSKPEVGVCRVPCSILLIARSFVYDKSKSKEGLAAIVSVAGVTVFVANHVSVIEYIDALLSVLRLWNFTS